MFVGVDLLKRGVSAGGGPPLPKETWLPLGGRAGYDLPDRCPPNPPDPRERLLRGLAGAGGLGWWPGTLGPRRRWNAVALFFNLPAARQPAGYRPTSIQDASNWLDEGVDPASPTISEFFESYWSTVSLGRVSFGVDTPRSSSGDPLVPTLDGDPADWGALINRFLELHAVRVWHAAGRRVRDRKRLIPSIVLVQRYETHASAGFGGFERNMGGAVYAVGDVTHVGYSLDFNGDPRLPHANRCRTFWGTLCHEWSHNFLEFADLYGPEGCTGYWDLLGDNSPPGAMSEISSVHKQRVGWLAFKQVIEGPQVARTSLALQPYTTTGEAYKVIPDPEHNPTEYFVLEYRKSTGAEPWRPDGALPEEGLMITHVNGRFGGPSGIWLTREAPYFDPESADYSERGATLWTGWDRLTGVLYPRGTQNAFTPSSRPSSDFYGGRPSGLSVTGIRLEAGAVHFDLSIDCRPEVGWVVGAGDRAVTGRFTGEAAASSDREGQEIFLRNDTAAVLVVPRQAQFFVTARNDGRIGGWILGPDDRQLVADLDGDGRDEIFVRNTAGAAVLKWAGDRFTTLNTTPAGGWSRLAEGRDLAADLDGDGRDELYTRSPDAASVFRYEHIHTRFGWDWVPQRLSAQTGSVDGWRLAAHDRELVGRFTRADRDAIVVRSPGWIGLFEWDDAGRRLRARAVTGGRVGEWALGGGDREVAGDFDGDGLDEIYIRSDGWAGLIKWQDDAFRLMWIRGGDLEHLRDRTARLPLSSSDVSYAGRFLPDRAGVLHRAGGRLCVLTWEGGQMKVRSQLEQAWNRWQLAPTDRFVLGDFHRSGRDVGDPNVDYIADGVTDVFIHNGWGTGMVGINHLPHQDQIGLAWFNHRELLWKR